MATKTIQVPLRMDEALHAAVQAEAVAQENTVSGVIRLAVRTYLERKAAAA